VVARDIVAAVLGIPAQLTNLANGLAWVEMFEHHGCVNLIERSEAR